MWMFLLTLAIVILPVPAFAFGPIAHVDLGLEVLAQVGVLGAGIGGLISRFRDDFLLGTLAADRIVGKWMAPQERHTHNWKRVMSRLSDTVDDRERACLLGYVCHLAADTVSHNYLVPSKMTECFDSPMAGHSYWEMRFDSRVRSRHGTRVLRALSMVTPEHAQFLRGLLPNTMFHAPVNYLLTGLSFRVQEGRAFAIASAAVDRGSRLAFSDEEVEEIYRLSVNAEMQALQGLEVAAVLNLDPRGLISTKMAQGFRRTLRRMVRHHSAVTETTPMKQEVAAYFRGQVTACLEG